MSSVLVLSSCNRHHALVLHSGEGMDEDIEARMKWETQMLADPATGKIPDYIRTKELTFGATLPKQSEPQTKSGSFWQSRGPWNVGGRTRSVAIDVTNENIIIAAGVSGGIYRSIDSGATWNKITGPSQDIDISCLVQDTRPGKTNIWYAGTGELIGNSAGGSSYYSMYYGDGILKSTDGGVTFSKIAATSYDAPQTYHPFDIVNNIAIDEADTGDILYAAVGDQAGNIYKSVNGGTSWTLIKGNGFSPNSVYTDVAVSPKGVIYFTRGTINSVSNNGSTEAGLYRSTDGITFTNITPTGFPGTYGRVVIGIDPNDENTVYFLGYTPGFGAKEVNNLGTVDYSSLWKYRYLSGTGTGAGGAWKNLTSSLPEQGGDFGNFNTQNGYDLYVRVKPGDSKTVFLGSTNLWRSTDSFSTSKNLTWIGGYGVNTSLPNYQLYPNQHPDEHNLVFYPSNPNKMITSCDGGVFRSDDNTAANVVYSSLNNGYLTTQFYTIAIDHGTPGNNEIIGGLQDNGSFMTRSSNQTDPWTMPGKGDGCFCAIANGRTDYYVSSELGKTYHEILDASGLPTQWARVDPLGAKGQIFVEPFVLDPNDQGRMYYVGNDRIWRNDDVTQIPLQNSMDTIKVATGWQMLAATAIPGGSISALAISNVPANRLVYGTATGGLFRMDDATSSNPTVKNITSSLFPSAYISCVAMSPLNADDMIVVFSNYNVISLFYTADGGTTWTNISANLEQNANGTGNGPSCRWASIMPIGHHFGYFIGTSIGLFSTDTLKGTNTVWAQQSPTGIGNDIVTMIDTRTSDGMVAVATHGNGVYSANISFPYQISGIDENGNEILSNENLKCYPNPVSSGGILNMEYDSKSISNHTIVSILDEEGRTIKQITNPGISGEGKQTIALNLPELKQGIYYVRFQSESSVATRAFEVR